jgi:hypothetical protein
MRKPTVSSIILLHVQLAESEITERNMPSVIQQDVLRLKITIDHTKPMQTFQSAQQLGGVEAGAVDFEFPFPLQMMEQFASVDERQNQVELFGGLEREFKRYDKRIVNLSQDRAFRQSVVNLRSRNDVGLSYRLQSVDTLGVTFPASPLVSVCGGGTQKKKKTG